MQNRSAVWRLQGVLPDTLFRIVEEHPLSNQIEELRLKRGGQAVLCMGASSYRLPYCCGEAAFEEISDKLLRHSRYAQEALLCKGYFLYPDGIRIGVSGVAVCSGDSVSRIRRIDGLTIRFPKTVRGVAAPLVGLMNSYWHSNGVGRGIMLFSLPGVGKTTVLRDLALTLSSPPEDMRVAVMDEREELFFGREAPAQCLLDIYADWPKTDAIEAAVRCNAPQILVCDEIGDEKEAGALLSLGGGIPLLCSVHGESVTEICNRPGVKELVASGRFFAAVKLHRSRRDAMGFTVYPLDTVAEGRNGLC